MEMDPLTGCGLLEIEIGVGVFLGSTPQRSRERIDLKPQGRTAPVNTRQERELDIAQPRRLVGRLQEGVKRLGEQGLT